MLGSARARLFQIRHRLLHMQGEQLRMVSSNVDVSCLSQKSSFFSKGVRSARATTSARVVNPQTDVPTVPPQRQTCRSTSFGIHRVPLLARPRPLRRWSPEVQRRVHKVLRLALLAHHRLARLRLVPDRQDRVAAGRRRVRLLQLLSSAIRRIPSAKSARPTRWRRLRSAPLAQRPGAT